jgi:hypothetical protein
VFMRLSGFFGVKKPPSVISSVIMSHHFLRCLAMSFPRHFTANRITDPCFQSQNLRAPTTKTATCSFVSSTIWSRSFRKKGARS